MTPRHLLLAAGLIASAALVLFDDTGSDAGIVEPILRTEPRAALEHAMPEKDSAAILALIPRENLIGGARAEQGATRLFASQSWTPPPPPPAPALPPPPPSAPPLPFTYLGKKVEDDQWEVFLAKGDQTLIVRAQSTIGDSYRIDAIKPPVLTLTYLPLNEVQTLTIGGTD